MKTLIAAAAVAISLVGAVAGTAHADGRNHRYERHHNQGQHKHAHERRGRGHDHHHWRDHRDSYRGGYYRGYREQRRYSHARYVRPHGYHARAWRRGDYLPRAYCSARYVVHDYDVYGLGRPPHGHYWVRVDNDVLLAAVASGLVVQAIYGVF